MRSCVVRAIGIYRSLLQLVAVPMWEGFNKDVDLHFRKCGNFYVVFEFLRNSMVWLGDYLLNPYWLHLSYFVGMSIVGFIPLWMSSTRSKRHVNPLDAYYTSVSAVTVTSLEAVRMEEVSEFHLFWLVILMLMGEEVFTSMASLHIERLTYHYRAKLAAKPTKLAGSDYNKTCVIPTSQLDLGGCAIPITPAKNAGGLAKHSSTRMPKSIPEPTERETSMENLSSYPEMLEVDGNDDKVYFPQLKTGSSLADRKIKREYNSNSNEMDPNSGHGDQAKVISLDLEARQVALACLGYIALIYLVSVQIVGIILITIYFQFSPHSRRILRSRGVKTITFAVFTTISSFANCGFTPLDDSMLPFRKDTLLLFTVAMQILLGNTMYAPCLRALISTLRRYTSDGAKKRTYDYVLQNSTNLCSHLLPRGYSVWLMLTIAGFLATQILILCGLHWGTQALDGLNAFEKIVCAIFQSVATRHAGESVVNPQLLYPAVILLYIALMYLPPYPVYLNPPPMKASGECSATRMISLQLQRLLFHDGCYLVVIVILICITEKDSLVTDPLNYNVLNIVFEVVSAYGNVGLSMGYSCRLLKKISNDHCKDVAISFSGKWSGKGKILIILVMFLGRLKGIQRASFPTHPIHFPSSSAMPSDADIN